MSRASFSVFAASTVSSTVLAASLAFVRPARADLVPEGRTMVPIELTIKGQDQLAGSVILVNDCSDKTGRHAFQLVKPSEPVVCSSVKRPIELFMVANQDRKAFDDLHAKDLGWGAERGDVEKLLPKARSCGKSNVSGFVDENKNIAKLTGTIELSKTAAGCAIKATSDLTPVTKDKDAARNVATPPAPASAGPSPDASGAPPGGCSRCATAPSTTHDGLAIPVGLAAALAVMGARRRAKH